VEADVEGTPFGRYRLVELLGRGGMGEVWRAYDTAIDRVVALKVLPANLADDPVFQQRFRREAKAAAGLDEPHVVPIHDYGEIDGRLYVTMRLIKGRDLQTILADGPLSPGRAVRIIEQIASALHAAHRIGLIHRDIKPSNILVAEDDFAYLIDFGIARAAGETGLTSTGAAIGTWAYMAPERLNSGRADARADIYALACVLYEALTGQRPYPGDSLEQQIVGHLTTPPPRPSALQSGVPQPMDAVIAKGMAKQPDQRYASTVELARAARDATTVPLPRPGPALPVHPSSQPDLPAAGPIHSQDTQLAVTGAAPVWQQPLGPPPWALPTPQRPMWQRPRIVVPALLAVGVLIAGGVFAAVKISQPHDNRPNPASTPGIAAPNTGPFTGTYRANFDPDTDMEGGTPGSPATETWGIRSACRPAGCVATASRRSGDTTVVSTLVFDDVGGRWLAVAVGSGTCQNAPAERWQVFTLQTRPDGTLSGEYSSTASNACGAKRTVTFTRTGDVDIASLADPATRAARVVSAAEALHGRYHQTVTHAVSGNNEEFDMAVRTDCLRTGARCMSFFHGPDNDEPLIFGSGRWIWAYEIDNQCPAGGTEHVKITAQFPLPQPPQDPITLLTGVGRSDSTGTACSGSDFDAKFVRTGD
jgi:serine/threonine protein kinase